MSFFDDKRGIRKFGINDDKNPLGWFQSILNVSSPITTSYVKSAANIYAIGVGGGGCNTINRLTEIGLQGVKIIAVNTDEAHLQRIMADKKILIGKSITNGLGVGGNPALGKQCAKKDKNLIEEVLDEPDLVFIAAGMGGGTGTGAAPVIAEIAKQKGAIVFAVVTIPFNSEGPKRMETALAGLNELQEYADTVAVISNEKLNAYAGALPFQQAFAIADYILAMMVKAVVEIIFKPTIMNLDLADFRNVVSSGGVAAIGIGEGRGKNKIEDALNMALNNPLLTVDINGSKGAIMVIYASPDTSLTELNKAGLLLTKQMDKRAEVKWGADVDPTLEDAVRILLVISGVKSPDLLPPKRKPWARTTPKKSFYGNLLPIDEELSGLDILEFPVS